jgi:hypothetical protein
MRHAALRVNPAPEYQDPADLRRRYEEILQRAMRYASRFVARPQASEIAHDVAVELIEQGTPQISGTIIYLRVTSRLRNSLRSSTWRAATDAAWLEGRLLVLPSWAQPGAELEAEELHDRIRETLVAMPCGRKSSRTRKSPRAVEFP